MVGLREPSHPERHMSGFAVISRVGITLNEDCPYCRGRLIEKHEEIKVERGKTIVFVHFRCVKCGKWIKQERL